MEDKISVVLVVKLPAGDAAKYIQAVGQLLVDNHPSVTDLDAYVVEADGVQIVAHAGDDDQVVH